MSRCIECGRPKEQHVERENPGAGPSWPKKSLQCPTVPEGSYKTMDLPDGQTCNDCGHFRFCTQFLGGDIATNTTCDWYPIRFVPKIERKGDTQICC